jgi:uncharacterized protein (TIGR00369 family)
MTQSVKRRSQAEQEKLHKELADLWEKRITFNQLLGFRAHSFDVKAPSVRFEMKPELVGHYAYGRLHGGVIASILDAAGGYGLMVAIGERHADENAEQIVHRFLRMGTIDLRVDFLSPGLGNWFEARATITRLGGRIGSTQMALTNDTGVLIATAAAAYVVS